MNARLPTDPLRSPIRRQQRAPAASGVALAGAARLGPIRRWAALLLGLLGLPLAAAANAEEPFGESEVKAVFLYNFASFVNWPQDARQDPAKPIRYCVLDDEIAPVLQKVLKDETMGGRSLAVQTSVTAAGLADCHILYLGKNSLRGSEGWALAKEAVAAHVLTVSDLESFETKGGMIALTRKDRRIHPRINIDAVDKGKLRISSKLLNLATIIRDPTAGN